MRRSREHEPELLVQFEEFGRHVHRAALLLRELVADYPERAALAGELLECEHAGDRLAHAILCAVALRGARGARLESADVHALVHAVDDVIDHAEEAADQLGLYGVEAPMEQAQEIAAVLVAAAGHLATALSRLRAGEGFAGELEAIHRLETEGDRLRRAAVADLFATGIDPMLVIRWKDIFETLERAVDACDTAANVLEGIVLKRAEGLDRRAWGEARGGVNAAANA
jgi:uncharacterized protein Yka (UPF0111/DUF47 family)